MKRGIRKHYTKPELCHINLQKEEGVLAACKVDTNDGTANPAKKCGSTQCSTTTQS